MKLCQLVASCFSKKNGRDYFAAASLVMCSMLSVMVPLEAQAAPKSWYVSKAPSAVLSDGKSWKSAWRELDKIVWTSVLPGDTVFIDGGSSAAIYSTPLQVQSRGNASGRITIRQSTEAGHSGQVILRGQSVGIDIPNRSYISVMGSRFSGILVQNCSFAGVRVSGTGATATFNVLENIEVANCGGANSAGSGIDFSGDQLTLNQVIVHDNFQSNVNAHLPNQNYAYGAINLKKCWIYNSTLGKSNGVVLDGSSAARPKLNITDCILGPGLVQSAKVGVQSTLLVDGALFINGTKGNVTGTSNSASGSAITLRNTTSFLTRLNAQGQAHSFIDAPGQPVQTAIERSIVFGGAVMLKPGRVGAYNTQFWTTGNTAAVSDKQVNPKFSTDVGAFANNASFATLSNADFAVMYGSPAWGKGARITSVRQLLVGY